MTSSTNTGLLTAAARERLAEVLGRMRLLQTDGVDELRELLMGFPNNLELLGHYAGALGYRGDHEGAVAVYDRYESLAAGNPEVAWRKADRLVNLGRLDEAEELYRQVAEEDPECFDAKMGLRYLAYLRRTGHSVGRHLGISLPAPREEQTRNRVLNEREYAEKRLRLRSLPHRLYLESTLKCNFACKTCSKGIAPYYAEDLQEAVLEKARRELLPSVTRISITGFGEPTMASNFDRLLELSIENGSEVFFVTNASLLNFERLEKLTSTPVDIIISIDGATKETFETIRRGGSFDLVMEKLAMIKKLRDIAMSQFVSRFSIHFVALRMNMHELPGVVRIAHRFGIPHVGVLDYHFQENPFDEQSPRFDPQASNRSAAEALALAKELGVSLGLPPEWDEEAPPRPGESLWQKIRSTRRLLPERGRFPRRCASPWTEPYLHTDGRVSPCCATYHYLGNLKREPFARIWNGWRYRLFRWRIESPVPPPPCRKCFNSWGINGGNAGNVIAREGLLIKGFYWAEYRVVRFWPRLRTALGMRDRALTDVVSAEPNFLYGKPIKKRSAGKN